MKEPGELIGYNDQYVMRTGETLYYNSSEVMHADPSSEALGVEAALVASALDRLNSGFTRRPKILDAGTGTGIGLAACVARARMGVDMYGFDNNLAAVRTAQHNVRRLMRSLPDEHQLTIFGADWHSLVDKTDIAARGPYDVILFNPPYLLEGTALFDGYEDCPRGAVYSDTIDGLEQYRTVLPWLATLLSGEVGASILIRRPMSSDTNPAQTIRMIESTTIPHIPPGRYDNRIATISYVRGVQVGQGRELAMTILSRAAERSSLPPHIDLLVNNALL